MTPWLQDADVTLYHGDVLDVLRSLEPESVDCVVTSPPYWGLRDYGNNGQIGLEETPDEFVASLVAVFREVRRVLAPHGTCWVNLGDSYNNVPWGQRKTPTQGGLNGALTSTRYQERLSKVNEQIEARKMLSSLKPKDLVGIPWRVAFALQADGWWLRSDIVWSKPNPMPESVTDRPTKAHEYVFLLTKQPKYFFDGDAIREPHSAGSKTHPVSQYAARAVVGPIYGGREAPTDRGDARRFQTETRQYNPAGRNARSVWEIATQPYPEAHFATYPEELVRRCVLAGCAPKACRECGEPSTRIVDRASLDRNELPRDHPEWRPSRYDNGKAGDPQSPGPGQRFSDVTTLGWSDCGHNTWRPGTVLDPFVGSGTSCKVARDHGRHSVGIDLNEQYLELAARRLQQQSLFSEAL